jgi:hypothetical protein
VLIEALWPKRRIMEMYLNVAETGIGTYGVEAAQRYYGHSAAGLSQVEAARIAAALPSPKKRAVVGATGFTRRHGNAIAKRSGVVRRDALDDCVYQKPSAGRGRHERSPARIPPAWPAAGPGHSCRAGGFRLAAAAAGLFGPGQARGLAYGALTILSGLTRF